MLKNVTLLRDQRHGRRTWKLLGPTGVPNEPFAAFVKAYSGKSKNTLELYSRQLAQFFDYLFEASALLHELPGQPMLSSSTLLDIIGAYDEYLVYGEDSGNEIAQLVSRTMPSPRNGRGTSSGKHAPVRAFLKLSDKMHQQTLELVNAGLLQRQNILEPLIDVSKLKVTPSAPQRQALIGNSMLAGVIAGGTKLVPSAILPTTVSRTPFEVSRAFPYDKIEEFIGALPSHRDKALYSLFAASGCRGHEGRQVLWDDIDIERRKVRLVDPATRPNCESYLYLTPDERYSLSWKGRTSEATLLLEPFASMFFEELALYLKYEYIPHGLHRFVFQYRHPKLQGRPYFLSDDASRQEIFKRAVAASGIENAGSGPHSFRHAYGMYLLNYFPRIDGGYGLGIGVVQQIMGHADSKSTEKYARHDRDLIEVELRFANAMVFGRGVTKSLVQMKIEVLNGQLARLQDQLCIEQDARRLLT